MGLKGFTGSTNHLKYLVLVIGCCLIPCAAVLGLSTTRYYVEHSSYFFDIEADHSFNVQGADADVLILGDSSLLTGVIPREITEKTGLKVYDQAVSAPVFAVFPDLAAALTDRYLAHNKRPKLIVLYLAPATRAHPPFVGGWKWYEGEALLWRYGKPLEILSYFAHHPDRLIPFIVLAGDRIHHRDAKGALYRDVYQALDAGEGYYVVPQSALDSEECTRPELSPDKDMLASFRKMAAERGLAAAVYLAPSPACDQRFPSTAQNFSQSIDNSAYTLKPGEFLNDNFLAHLNSAGAEENSQIVGEFLEHRMSAKLSQVSSP